ncbi:hypothetical protein C0995_014740 [Termitomyces sp. Mi166|nr:hypothetical protein C0995_014740 [Termitomyces sp. Mi166\
MNKAGNGILGLGPNNGSNIYKAISTTTGAALLDRIFLQNLTTPNYLTVLLGRSGDPTDFYGGSLTIGQVIAGFEDILKEPKLSVVNSIADDLHFQVLLDKNGLIGPDGKPIVIHTKVDSTPNEDQVTVVLDTGFSLPQVPSSVAAEIYGGFLGAQLVDIDSVGKIWLLPCSQEVNITFKFNNKSYPVHPLDVTLDPMIIGMSGVVDSEGQPLCIGTFQPFTYDTGAEPSYDMVLGMAFLRNIYVLMDYGDFILGSDQKAAPYVQFLSTTNATEAHADFVKVRLSGADNTVNPAPKLRGFHSVVYYIAIAITLVMIMVVTALFFIFRARRRNVERDKISFLPNFAQESGASCSGG